ncbi:peptidoglycan DD-metalloendopeptidase family protein [Thermodesulfovibrio sp.]|uniref:murein hydrolase activator EnvC family protein n=1 Tax=Thermodesulfovibrio sp. TaxID=2067987 RepID=UPI00309B83AF
MLKRLIISIIFIFTISLSFCFAAQPKEELKNIKKEIDVHKKKLQETRKVERDILEELKKVSMEIDEINRKIENHRVKIRNIRANILKTEKEIQIHSSELEMRKLQLSSRLISLQRLNHQPDPYLLLLFEKDLSKAFRLMRNTQKIMNVERQLIEKYREELNRLVYYEKELKGLYVSLKEEENSLRAAQDEQQKKRKEKERLLVKVRQDKESYEKRIKELEETARRLTRLLQETEKKEHRTGKTESLPDTGFTKRRGTLLWPVSGSVVAHYGNQRDPVFNVPVFRSGIYIKASPGTSVKASAEGKVVYANYFKGYENLVIISHGDGYYTVYGNLDSMAVKEGSYVKEGQTIGTVSDKSNIDTSALYFELRYRGKPLNPEQWLKK